MPNDSKSDLNDTFTADALKALGHPIRLRIIRELSQMESCFCADMCDCFSQSQSTISQHLSVLRDAGILNFEKQGNKSCYSLDRAALKKLHTALNELVQSEPLESTS